MFADKDECRLLKGNMENSTVYELKPDVINKIKIIKQEVRFNIKHKNQSHYMSLSYIF